MAAKGKRLVVSLKNGFNDASPVNQKVGHPCPVPMDEIVKGMAGVPWIRYHEYFAAFPPLRQPAPKHPGEQPRVNGSSMCHNTIKTAMQQAALPDMAFAVHGGTYNDQASLNLTFAVFMLGRNGMPGQPTDWFSWSTGDFWLSHDWSWKNTSSLYGGEWGLPKGPALRTGSLWRREYEKATITLDCDTLKPTITQR